MAINPVGDRKVDSVIQIFQGDAAVPIMYWVAAEDAMDIVYPNTDWQGIIWAGGATQVGRGTFVNYRPFVWVGGGGGGGGPPK